MASIDFFRCLIAGEPMDFVRLKMQNFLLEILSRHKNDKQGGCYFKVCVT